MKMPMLTEYLSPQEVQGICKIASAPPQGEPDWKQRAKIVGAGLLGMSAGTALGFGGMELANRLHMKAHGGKGIPSSALNIAVPALGGAAGLAYSLYKAKEMEEIKRAVKPQPDDNSPDQ
jgi:hypothetical protein